MTSRSHVSKQHNYRHTGDGSVAAGRANTQQGWYELASTFVQHQTVLDVGCGLGEGLGILSRTASSVVGQDLDDRLKSPTILIQPIETIDDQSYDTVTSIEVIEHVEEAGDFVKNLFRIARRQVFLTTPNWTASRCQWPYHVREYTPRELVALVAPYGSTTLYKGTPSGHRHFRVKSHLPYFLLNDAMAKQSTEWCMKYLHKLLLPRHKIGSNIAVRVDKC